MKLKWLSCEGFVELLWAPVPVSVVEHLVAIVIEFGIGQSGQFVYRR